jgi:signal transduction histidine kinase
MEPRLHSLLKRQLRRHSLIIDDMPPAFRSFIDDVDDAYRHFDEDRGMLERTLELSSNELLNANSELRAIFQALPDLFFRLDASGTILSYKAGSSNDLYLSPEKLLGKRMQDFPMDSVASLFRDAICQVSNSKTMQSLEYVMNLHGAKHYYEARLIPFLDGDIIVLVRNITERKVMQNQLSQAQKMESIGQLAAGMAHEINTPTQFLGDNIHFLQDAFNDMRGLLVAWRQLHAAALNADADGSAHQAAECMDKIDVDYYLEEIPAAIRQSLGGVDRIASIIRSIKDFAHPDAGEKRAVDLNKAIQSTITVAHSEWKYVAEVETDFDSKLPLVFCFQGDINQVILNLLVNAAHAIADVVGENSEEKGRIRVATKWDDPWVDIRVSDTGTGIPESIRSRIFDPFFTTKEVGRGTGQGLAIAHTVVVEKHGGTISFETETGKGTTFIVRLPQPDSH